MTPRGVNIVYDVKLREKTRAPELAATYFGLGISDVDVAFRPVEVPEPLLLCLPDARPLASAGQAFRARTTTASWFSVRFTLASTV